ncbi:hypothetical protein OAA64_02075 [bacterium]|jgi:hypothetical protein|nr:hypothetical protein [bacterium]
MKTFEELGKLQGYVADTYKSAIDQMHETGEYNPSLLNGARQLLKDNEIVLTSGKDTPLNDLLNEVLPFEDDIQLKQKVATK